MNEIKNVEIPTSFDLKLIVQKIEKVSGQKAKFDTYLKQEYLMGSNVTEEHLLDVGFKFVEYGQYNHYPIYKYGDILAIYIGNVLHVMKENG